MEWKPKIKICGEEGPTMLGGGIGHGGLRNKVCGGEGQQKKSGWGARRNIPFSHFHCTFYFNLRMENLSQQVCNGISITK